VPPSHSISPSPTPYIRLCSFFRPCTSLPLSEHLSVYIYASTPSTFSCSFICIKFVSLKSSSRLRRSRTRCLHVFTVVDRHTCHCTITCDGVL
jgi:hypothetical protein